jgi:hypothetical protein
MKVRRDPDVEAAPIGFLSAFSGLPAKLDIVLDRVPKATLKFINGATLKGHEIVDALDPAVKALVFRAIINGA